MIYWNLVANFGKDLLKLIVAFLFFLVNFVTAKHLCRANFNAGPTLTQGQRLRRASVNAGLTLTQDSNPGKTYLDGSAATKNLSLFNQKVPHKRLF